MLSKRIAFPWLTLLFASLWQSIGFSVRGDASAPAHTLADLKFQEAGVVRSDMHWSLQTEPCYYVETLNNWSCRWGTPTGGGSFPYLWRVEAPVPSRSETGSNRSRINAPSTPEQHAGLATPPLGLRSAVPLGGLGAGTVELRADGSLRDWNIFNNSPGGGEKVQLDEALFGVWVKTAGDKPRALSVRTSPPAGLPPVAQIEYAGAYPVSRLRLSDASLPIRVDLYGYSEWVIGNAQASATPAIVFTFRLSNPTEQPVVAAVCFNLPNHMRGVIRPSPHGLRWDRSGTTSLSGSMAIAVSGEDQLTRGTTNLLSDLWQDFAQEGTFSTPPERSNNLQAAVAAKLSLPAGATREVNLVLAWSFPHRTFGHDAERIGNFYADLYKDAEDAAARTMARLPEIWHSLYQWQEVCFENDLPPWLQDALMNSASTMAKTGLWTQDGRWRQWESFSCSALDPVHIHWYRALPYAFFFPSLERSELRGYARGQEAGGFIHEDLGGAASKLDSPGGRSMGDCTSTFILAAYEHAIWTGDPEWLHEAWPHVRKAAEWQMSRSSRFGLPEHLNNTYDWWDFEKKDVVAYNAVLHLAAIRAAEKMADRVQDGEFGRISRDHFEMAAHRLDELLWTGSYYRAWWMGHGEQTDALHVDTLYGQLWASVLGLGWVVDPVKVRAHLAAEARFCDGPSGLKVMHGRKSEMIDDLIWQAGSIDWTALNLYADGSTKASYGEAEKVIRNWRDHLADFWDWRDLSRSDNGLPWCNSHYARQAILWAIPLALSGQQYSAFDKRLTFDPVQEAPKRLPWYVPGAAGALERSTDNQYTLRVLSGRIELKQWTVGKLMSHVPVNLRAGEAALLDH
jgi:non-lysosomal glucosylceramidase